MATPLIIIAIGASIVFALNVFIGADLLAIGGLLMLVGALAFVGTLFADVAKRLWKPEIH